MGDMATQFDPASGTRDLLADDVAKRERAFDVIRRVFAGYGFEPLQTPAFERLDVLMGKYGEDGDKLVFKILRRGTTTRCRSPGWPRRTAAGCRRHTSGTCSARCGAPSGRARTATASSCSATWTRSAPPRRSLTRRCSAPTTTRWPRWASTTSKSS